MRLNVDMQKAPRIVAEKINFTSLGESMQKPRRDYNRILFAKVLETLLQLATTMFQSNNHPCMI